MNKGCGCQTGILKHIKPPYADLFHLPCCIHDDDYDIGGDAAARRTADRNLFRRCVKIVNRSEMNPWRVMWLVHVAMLYYIAVRVLGFMFFKFDKSK